MKIVELITLFSKSRPRTAKRLYAIAHNNNLLPKYVVKSDRLAHETYKMLRHYKIEEHESIFLIRRAKGVNTLFFNVNFDIVVCDGKFTIIDPLINVSPGFVSNYYRNGHFVYFAPVGFIRYFDIKKGDQLRAIREWFI